VKDAIIEPLRRRQKRIEDHLRSLDFMAAYYHPLGKKVEPSYGALLIDSTINTVKSQKVLKVLDGEKKASLNRICKYFHSIVLQENPIHQDGIGYSKLS